MATLPTTDSRRTDANIIGAVSALAVATEIAKIIIIYSLIVCVRVCMFVRVRETETGRQTYLRNMKIMFLFLIFYFHRMECVA